MSKTGQTVTREEMYKRVWETPMETLGAEFGITGRGLTKICKQMKVPSPSRGYWAKLAAGRKMHIPPLPQNVECLAEYTIHPTERPEQIEETEWFIQFKEAEAKPENAIRISADLENAHIWVKGAFRRLKKITQPNEMVRQFNVKLPIQDVTVGQAPRALLILDALLQAFANRGIKVKHEHSGIVVKIHQETLEIIIREKVSRRYLTKRERNAFKKAHWYERFCKDTPNGRLQFLIKSSEYALASYYAWSWAETNHRQLEDHLNEVMLAIANVAMTNKQKRIDKAKQEVLWAQEKEEHQGEVFEIWKERRRMDEFREWAQKWREAEQLKTFFDKFETYMATLPTNHKAQRVLETARAALPDIDPFQNGKILDYGK